MKRFIVASSCRAVALYFAVLSCFTPSLIVAAEPEQTLPAVTVTATRREQREIDIPAAVSRLDKDAIQTASPMIGLDESMNRVPGVLVQNRYNFAQDLKVTIRGFGSRAAFGIRGVKLVVDGIPDTLPDGQSQVDSLDLGSTERIEVIRGTSSALYGNASGGVIALTTEAGSPTPFTDYRASFGSYGFSKHQLKTSGESYTLNLSRMSLDGYRANSETEHYLLNGKSRVILNESATLTTVLSVVHAPTANDPGALSREAMDEDARQAFASNVTRNAGESVTQGRFGAVLSRDFGDTSRLSLTSHGLFRDFSQRLPVNTAVDFDRVAGGVGAQFETLQRLGVETRAIVGVDVQHQGDDRRNFDNPEGGIGESPQLHQNERVTALGGYVSVEPHVGDRIGLTVGARVDRLKFDVNDLLVSNGDDSGSRDMDAISPSAGVVLHATPRVSLYANVSTAFETPTTTELANRPNGSGGFNPDLEPQRAVSVETGVKGASSVVRYEIALYRIGVRDELIPFEAEIAGRTYFRNAGSSTHQGVEMFAHIEPIRGTTAALAYTYADSTFDEYRTANATFDGKRVPGIPAHHLFGEVAYRREGIFGAIEAEYIDKMMVDDANTDASDAYVVVNARVAAEIRARSVRVEPYIRLNNLLNTTYSASIRQNAFGGRYFPWIALYIFAGVGIRWDS